jgi:hypothetical protein
MSDAGAISLLILNVFRTSGPVVHWLSMQNTNDRWHENSICSQAMQENWRLLSCNEVSFCALLTGNKGLFHCIKYLSLPYHILHVIMPASLCPGLSSRCAAATSIIPDSHVNFFIITLFLRVDKSWGRIR